jgi:mycofactocin precursor
MSQQIQTPAPAPAAQTAPAVPVCAPAPVTSSAATAAPDLVAADLLVEDVSIDGMCGVY